MNKEISKILRDKLREGDGLAFVEKYVGMVQTVVRDDPNEGATKKSRFPVATEVFINNICQSNEQIITPDSGLKGLIYFEDNGTNPDGKKYVSNLTLICWINRAKIVSNIYSEITGIAIQNILNKIGVDENPENVSMFQGLTVSLTKIFPQEASLFSKYTYDESVTQYLRPPFEFFGLGLQIKYGINSKCIEPLTITENEVCY